MLRGRRMESARRRVRHERAVAERPDARPAGDLEVLVHADPPLLGPARERRETSGFGCVPAVQMIVAALISVPSVRRTPRSVTQETLVFAADLDAPLVELPLGVAAELLATAPAG